MYGSAKLFGSVYFLACSAVISVAAVLPSGSGGPIAVFSSPWGDPALEVIARAEGRIVYAGGSSWVAVTDQSDPALIGRLYSSGAGFVASALVARACAGLAGTSLEKMNE